MARTAVVTGGSRGIGAAISKALKQAGYNVAANYAGNDEAAAKFKQETGIPVFSYYDSHGNDLVAANPSTPANVANCAIRVHMSISSDSAPGPQPFTENLDVELRNRLPGGTIGCPT